MTEKLNTNGEITTADVKRQKQIANLKPLKETENMTEDEKAYIREIRLKGGKARGEQLKKAKNLKELANMLLETRVSKERAKDILGDIADDIPTEDLTNGALLMARMFNECFENGTVKSAEYIRDTSGQKPSTDLTVTTNAISDNDRELLRNIAERMKINPEKDHTNG